MIFTTVNINLQLILSITNCGIKLVIIILRLISRIKIIMASWI